MDLNYTDINAATIDQWIADGWEWGKPITHDTYAKALEGEWDVLLTPTRPVPHEWFPEIRNARILGLACGGGQQMPIFAALGGKCTVLDYSAGQLESERMVSKREGYDIDIVRADMTQPLPFGDEQFDIIFHPVSNCYIRDVHHVWRECRRVLKKGGVLLSGLDNGVNFIVDDDEKSIVHPLPFDPLENRALYDEMIAKGDGVQFSHTFEDQIGGQLKAGFMITHVFEDTNGAGRLHEMNIPSFWATRAVKL